MRTVLQQKQTHHFGAGPSADAMSSPGINPTLIIYGGFGGRQADFAITRRRAGIRMVVSSQQQDKWGP
jgi:hypothetical protein